MRPHHAPVLGVGASLVLVARPGRLAGLDGPAGLGADLTDLRVRHGASTPRGLAPGRPSDDEKVLADQMLGAAQRAQHIHAPEPTSAPREAL